MKRAHSERGRGYNALLARYERPSPVRLNLAYRNVYPGRGNKTRYGGTIFYCRRWADESAGGGRIGVETICRTPVRYAPPHTVVVFYQPTR